VNKAPNEHTSVVDKNLTHCVFYSRFSINGDFTADKKLLKSHNLILLHLYNSIFWNQKIGHKLLMRIFLFTICMQQAFAIKYENNKRGQVKESINRQGENYWYRKISITVLIVSISTITKKWFPNWYIYFWIKIFYSHINSDFNQQLNIVNKSRGEQTRDVFSTELFEINTFWAKKCLELVLERGMQTSLLHMSEFPLRPHSKEEWVREALDNFYGLPLVTFF
jgi:hypothetical protein